MVQLMPELGLFNDEGCFEAQMYSWEEARLRRQEYIDLGEQPDDVIIKMMCPDHDGEAKDSCEECLAESEED